MNLPCQQLFFRYVISANQSSIMAKNSHTEMPSTLKGLQRQFQGANGLIFGGLLLGIMALYFIPKEKNKKLATARWAQGKEKLSAVRLANKQINERKRDGLTSWINSPIIKESQQNKPGIDRFKVKPGKNTIFIPDCQRGTLVTGAPGWGKTFSVIDPMVRSILEQGFPMILYDFKFPGQAKEHIAYARHLGYEVRIFAPGFAGTDVCNLLDFLRDANDATTAAQIAKVLNKNFTLNGAQGGQDPFWEKSGDQLVKALFQTAKLSPYGDFLLCQKLLSKEPQELAELVKNADLSPWIRVSWDQFVSMKQSEKTIASVHATAALMFANFVLDDLLPCLTGKSTIPLDLAGKQLIVFGMDQQRRDIIGPIIATVMHMLIVRNIAKQRKDPLAVILDELPTLALPSLVNWLNESRSAGFCGVLGCQNLNQLEKTYGKQDTRSIITGCSTKFIFNMGEHETADYYSKYLGDEEKIIKKTSRSVQSKGNSRTYSQDDKSRRLTTADEFLKLRIGECVLINPGYEGLTETNVPIKLRIKLNPSELSKGRRSRTGYDAVIRKLTKQCPLKPVTVEDINLREAEVDKILSPNAGEVTKQRGSTLDQLVNSTANSDIKSLLLEISKEFDQALPF
jgi:type IV secretory pathway TraG/TraD family ATPase VirD4